MLQRREICTPITEEIITDLRVGEQVYISGQVYTARDAAHARMVELVKKKAPPPFDYHGQIVFYSGPCPNRPGQIIGPIGPTTSGRMDIYTPLLIQKGLKVMIGKGLRNETVKQAIVRHRGLYLAAIGGAAALMSQCVTEVELIAFEDLGTEAIRRLTMHKLPVVVAIDIHGHDIYQGPRPWPPAGA